MFTRQHFTWIPVAMQKGLKKFFINMDEYLASLGLYRKMVARDASSLFRAVSEQLYYTQNYHGKIRQGCADFMRANSHVFEPFVEGSFEKYLERLEDPKETVGQVEIKALSQLYSRCFLIYRNPGKPPTVISEDDVIDKVMLCCSINGHYDIVYPRSYPASAALCQSLVYEILYLKVLGREEAELSQAMETFRVGGRRYRNSASVCSDVDVPCDSHTSEARPRDDGEEGTSEERCKPTEDIKVPLDDLSVSRSSLPYKVMKSLDNDVYRNVEFDVWQDTCKEMQKMDYMVFAGRQYFLGDKCQVRLEPKGKFYNAFIQEVGNQASSVTVFIEELGEKHLVPLTDLKPVNPVPAWNVAPPRKGDPDKDCRGGRHHRQRYFRKSRSIAALKGAELLMPPPPPYRGPAPSALPPRFQPAGHPRPTPPSAGALTFDPYVHGPPHAASARLPRFGAASSSRFLNRHLIGPQLTYYPASRRFYDYDNLSFRSRRSRRHLVAGLDKECQFGFATDAGEESSDLDAGMAYYQLEDGTDGVYTSLQGQTMTPPSIGGHPTQSSSYRIQRGSLPPPPPSGNTSEEEQEESSTVEDPAEFRDDFLFGVQDTFPASADLSINQDEQEGDATDSPPSSEMTFTPQAVKPLNTICSSPSSSSSSPSSSITPAAGHTQPRSVAVPIPASSHWLVNELGEPVYTVVAPPTFSYDPNGSDLPRDHRVLQYYFNLGVQSCWQQQQQVFPPTPPESYPYQHYPSYPGQEQLYTPLSYHEAGRGAHPLVSYPESTRTSDVQSEAPGCGSSTSVDSSSLVNPPSAPPSSTIMYQDQSPLPPPPVLHLQYEAPPPPTYLPSGPPTSFSHPTHYSYHSFIPPSSHWGAAQSSGHTQRVYCPVPSPSHVVSYISAPPPHHATSHFLPPAV
ncbi:putative bifunctional UDP-N-acetylglucosamine transferase and deubiquitinase ALG13 isoform 4-T4 [Synchiropus picturatus]